MTTESSSTVGFWQKLFEHLKERGDGSGERGHSLTHDLRDLVLHIRALHCGLPQALLDGDGGIHDLALGVAVLLLHVLADVLQQGHHRGGEVGCVQEDLGVSLSSGLISSLSLSWLQSTPLDSDSLASVGNLD